MSEFGVCNEERLVADPLANGSAFFAITYVGQPGPSGTCPSGATFVPVEPHQS